MQMKAITPAIGMQVSEFDLANIGDSDAQALRLSHGSDVCGLVR